MEHTHTKHSKHMQTNYTQLEHTWHTDRPYTVGENADRVHRPNTNSIYCIYSDNTLFTKPLNNVVGSLGIETTCSQTAHSLRKHTEHSHGIDNPMQ